MSGPVLESETFVPNDQVDQKEQLASVLSFLEAHKQRRGTAAQPSYALVGTGEHDRIELPQTVHEALIRVVAALWAGKAVTVAPQSLTLTSQQAADLLGVSRPTVKRLIEKGELRAERVGTRHKLRLDEVLRYRDVRRERQYDAIAATSIAIDDEDDPKVVLDQLRDARRAIADRRKAKG